MIKTPAHKQTDPNKKPGQRVNNDLDLRYQCYLSGQMSEREAMLDKTLADYIQRKSRQDAFNSVSKETRLTFEEWCDQHWPKELMKHPYNISMFRSVWNAAQENK